MPKYLIQASYTSAGVKGIRREGGTKRQTAVDMLVRELGGRLEAFYYAFGETDVVAIVDLPDNVSAATMSMTIAASDAVTLRTTPLLTPDEMDRAAQRQTDKYRPPGS